MSTFLLICLDLKKQPRVAQFGWDQIIYDDICAKIDKLKSTKTGLKSEKRICSKLSPKTALTGLNMKKN